MRETNYEFELSTIAEKRTSVETTLVQSWMKRFTLCNRSGLDEQKSQTRFQTPLETTIASEQWRQKMESACHDPQACQYVQDKVIESLGCVLTWSIDFTITLDDFFFVLTLWHIILRDFFAIHDDYDFCLLRTSLP